MKMVKHTIRVCRCLWRIWYMGTDGETGCGGRGKGVYVCVRRDGCVSVEGEMGVFV